MKHTGIYIIQSISKPERVYVGSAIDLKDRLRKHISDLQHNKHHSPTLQNHFNKYGESDLSFEVLESGEYVGKEHLLAREQGWYIPYGGMNKDGLPYFNIAKIAGSNFGTTQSDEARKKKSLAGIGRVASVETRKKRSEANKGQVPWIKGKHHSSETIIKMRKPKSEEHKNNISKALIGNTYGIGNKGNLGKPSPLKGTTKSEESRKKMREGKILPILQYDLQGNFIKEWLSPIIAARELLINNGSISHCLIGDNKTGGGFIWKYKFDNR
jgi:group I intron endonuclease